MIRALKTLTINLLGKWLISLLILSAFTTLIITFLMISYLTVKAARANPVDSLRYE